MNVNININLVSTLERLANERSITSEQYAENYLEAHLRSQFTQNLVDTIRNQTIDDAVTISDAIKPITDAITERENAKNVVVEENIENIIE